MRLISQLSSCQLIQLTHPSHLLFYRNHSEGATRAERLDHIAGRQHPATERRGDAREGTGG